MRRRDTGNPQVSSHARVDDVRSIAMRMDRIGAHRPTQGRDRRALAPIRPGGYHNPMRIDPGAAQGSEERVPGRRSGEDRRDVHLMTQAPQPSPQHLYHALSRIPAPSALRQASLAAKRAANAWTRSARLAQAISSRAVKTRPANPSSADPRARANRVVSTTSSPIPMITPAPTAG